MPDAIGTLGTVVADAGAGAGAGAGDAGAGAGTDAGAGAGTGAGGAGADGAAAEGTEGDPGADGAGSVEGAEGGDAGEGDSTEESGLDDSAADADGRKIDSKTRSALAELKKTNPEAAARLSDNYHRGQAIIKEVGATNLSDAVNKVRQMAATVESLGGEEGIVEMQTEISDYRAEIAAFSAGDPALLKQLHTSNPEAFATNVANSLELLAADLPSLDKAIMPTVMARLERAGMFNSVATLMKLIEDGKGQDAYNLTAQMNKWLNDAKAYAAKNVEIGKAKDPAREKLEKERAEFETQKTQQYENQVGADVNQMNNSAMSKTIEPFFKEIRLQNEGRREFVNALQQRIWAKMKLDAPFQRAAKSIKAQGDVKRTAEFVSNKFQELLPEEFRSLRNAMYPSYKRSAAPAAKGAPAAAGAPKPNGAAAAAAPGPVAQVTAKPNREDVDWAKTGDTEWIKGHAFLKNGKEVRWNWKAV